MQQSFAPTPASATEPEPGFTCPADPHQASSAPTPSQPTHGTPIDHGAHLEDGPALTTACLRRLIDDGRIRFALTAPGGRILDPGRSGRTPNASQFRALWRRDHGCTVPGCGRTRFLQSHHVVYWSNGGPTILDNLVLLCSRHHRSLHEGEFTIQALGRQRFRFLGPDGVVYSPAPTMSGDADDLITQFPGIRPETIQPDRDPVAVPSSPVTTLPTAWGHTVNCDKTSPEEADDETDEQGRTGEDRTEHRRAG